MGLDLMVEVILTMVAIVTMMVVMVMAVMMMAMLMISGDDGDGVCADVDHEGGDGESNGLGNEERDVGYSW